MKTAFVVFNDLTILDFIGPYDALTRLRSMGILPEFNWDVCAVTETVQDEKGLAITPTKVGNSLGGYDLLVVPGGVGTRQLFKDQDFVAWIGSAQPVPLKASVCTGALLLGAAGFLTGRRATTHPRAFHYLEGLCREVVAQRIVDEGDVVTAGGVTAGIDLGLHLVRRLAGTDARATVAQQMDYPWGEHNTLAAERE